MAHHEFVRRRALANSHQSISFNLDARWELAKASVLQHAASIFRFLNLIIYPPGRSGTGHHQDWTYGLLVFNG